MSSNNVVTTICMLVSARHQFSRVVMFCMYKALRDNGMVQGSGNESFAIALCDPSRITGQISRNRAVLRTTIHAAQP